jgi:hypothetical protein
MSEYLSSCHSLEAKQIKEAERVGKRALEVVDSTYGEGYPSWNSGRRELAYHNGHHGRAVGNAAIKLCRVYDIPQVEQAVAQTAGFAHDLVQLKGRGVDERESAEWLESQLALSNLFPDSLRRMGALAIVGTEPLFSNGQLVGQKATDLEYPDEISELVAKSVACADLGELYTPQGPYLAHQLFREIKGMPNESELPFEEIAQFQRNQIGLLERYTYPLKKANSLLATHRPQVIRYSKDVLRKIETGSIDSWERLMQNDEVFMEKNR